MPEAKESQILGSILNELRVNNELHGDSTTILNDILSETSSVGAEVTQTLNELLDVFSGNALADKEAMKESSGSSAPAVNSGGSGSGLGMAGKAGAIAGGGGLLMGGLGLLAGALGDIDGKKIRETVNELLHIKDDFGGTGDFFLEGGMFAVTMTGIGVGIAAFGIGSAVGGVGEAIATFAGGDDWAKDIKKNVNTLLSITEGRDFAKVAAEVVKFPTLMAALGLGLIAFGVGSAVAGAGNGIAKGIDKFSGGTWSDDIVYNVNKLLEITEGRDFAQVASSVIEFPTLMAALGLGLLAFSAGSVAAAASGGVAKGIDSFGDGRWSDDIVYNVNKLLEITEGRDFSAIFEAVTKFPTLMAALGAGLVAFAVGESASNTAQATALFDGGNFADNIVANVETLLQIPKMDGVGADAGKFSAVMTGIGAGLVAFAIGEGAAGTAGAISKFSDGGNFGEKIKKEVVTILSILNDPNVSKERAIEFNSVMGSISKGLIKFATGSFVSDLGAAAGAILGFFTGSDSPIVSMLSLAKNQDKLFLASEAIDKLTISLGNINRLTFNGSKLNMKAFAEDLVESVPLIEAAIMGGSGGLFGSDFKGLADPSINYEAAIKRIKALRSAFSAGGGAGSEVNGSTNDLNNAVNARDASAGKEGAGANNTVVDKSSKNTNSNNSNTYNIYGAGPPPIDGLNLDWTPYQTGIQ